MSIINKINYEQFAMDYLEGNLSGDLLQEMILFLEKNPAIKEELNEMELFYLEADESIVFEEKETLLKPVTHRRIFILRPIFLIASCLLICTLISVFFFMNNDHINNENEIAIEEKNIIIDNDKENNIVVEKKEVIRRIENIDNDKSDNDEFITPEKIDQEEIKTNKALPVNSSGKHLNDEQPIAIQKEKLPVYPQEPIIEKPMDISPVDFLEYDSQPVVSNVSHQEDPYVEPEPIRVTNIIASINLEPIDNSFEQDIQLDKIAIVDESNIPEKQSRLVRMGLIPEREGKRKISFKTIREALVPEGFASRE